MSAKNSKENDSLTGKQLLALVRCRLKMQSALGVDMYPANDDLQRFFELTENNGRNLRGLRASSGTDHDQQAEDPADEAGHQLKLLEHEIAVCRGCYLHMEKKGNVVGGGNNNCRLMVVGDCSEQLRGEFSDRIYFGRDEDVMLWKMMAAIGLRPEDVYVTNCLKCSPGGKGIPDTTCEKNCFSYLEREISLLRPEVICAMGEVASGLLTGRTDPLARLRGKFFRYRYQSNLDIQVMPTYHPRFLLRHQEMKKATWLDLQAIQKKLAEK